MTQTETKLDQFTTDYLATALWSSMDDDDSPLDNNYAISDIATEAWERAIADCRKFQDQEKEALEASAIKEGHKGHDFWLNRNGHGSGFWDEHSQTICDDYNREQEIAVISRDFSARDALNQTCSCPYHVCQRLSKAAKSFGSCDIYVGDDGKLYFQ